MAGSAGCLATICQSLIVPSAGDSRQVISNRLPDPFWTAVRTSIVGPPLTMGNGDLADRASLPRIPVPTLDVAVWGYVPAINSRLPLPLRTAVTTLDESSAVIVTRLTSPAWELLSPRREIESSSSRRQQISSKLPLPARTAVTSMLSLIAVIIAIWLASPRPSRLSWRRVIVLSPGGTSQEISSNLSLPLRTAVMARRP